MILPRAGGRHRHLDPPYADPHQRTEFQQPEPEGAACGIGELRVGQSDAAERAELFRDSSDGRSATLADGRSDWPTVGLAQPSV